MPLLALLLVALIEFGLLIYAHVQVANAAREGARAASLYRNRRYASIDNYSNPPDCASGIDGWSLDQTVQQAIVARELESNGCPKTSGAILSTSLGRLDPQPTSPAWTVTVSDPAFLPQSGTDMPAAGRRGTVTLRYPYRLPILAPIVPALRDPVWIGKSVEFEYQQ
jgi:hypothetical protein